MILYLGDLSCSILDIIHFDFGLEKALNDYADYACTYVNKKGPSLSDSVKKTKGNKTSILKLNVYKGRAYHYTVISLALDG